MNHRIQRGRQGIMNDEVGEPNCAGGRQRINYRVCSTKKFSFFVITLSQTTKALPNRLHHSKFLACPAECGGSSVLLFVPLACPAECGGSSVLLFFPLACPAELRWFICSILSPDILAGCVHTLQMPLLPGV
jgi:hypothetical protein